MAYLQCHFYSVTLEKNVDVQIILPSIRPDDYIFGTKSNYYQQGNKFQTLYLLHGSYDDGNSWLLNTSIARYAQEKCLAVVMPSAEDSNYQNMVHGEKFLTYVAQELPLKMAQMLPLSKKRENTFIAGNSMGGGGAFRCAFTYSKIYGAAASLSGALEMKELTDFPHSMKLPIAYRKAIYGDEMKKTELLELLESVNISTLPRLYMICGMEDFIFQSNENFYKKATKMGLTITYKKCHGTHNWSCWDKWIQDVLDWLPLKGTSVKC
jgi:S-formylglutathione hydrolase FrmB